MSSSLLFSSESCGFVSGSFLFRIHVNGPQLRHFEELTGRLRRLCELGECYADDALIFDKTYAINKPFTVRKSNEAPRTAIGI